MSKLKAIDYNNRILGWWKPKGSTNSKGQYGHSCKKNYIVKAAITMAWLIFIYDENYLILMLLEEEYKENLLTT